MSNTCRKIAILNQKGGVGKTCTTINLAHELTKRGKKVCVIDADHQGNLTETLGINHADLDPSPENNGQIIAYTFADLLAAQMRDYEISITDGLIQTDFGFWLIPSTIRLSEVEFELHNAMARESIAKKALEKIDNHFDYILIDCPPSLSLIVYNILTYADEVLVPCEASAYAAGGVRQMLQVIRKIRKNTNPTLNINGILLTKIKKNTRIATGVYEAFYRVCEAEPGLHLYDVQIPQSVDWEYAVIEHKPISEYNKKSPVALAYSDLATEFLSLSEPEEEGDE